ncbi:MAG: hypothetical protein RL318_1086 [Fibrobacterota bacterium]|jgi:hypothetical protein
MPTVPTLEAVLDRTCERIFPQLLEELAFADAWSVAELDMGGKIFSSACDFDAPWEWTLVVEGSHKCMLDIAAGYHSLPEEHMDDQFAAEFLLEICFRFAQRVSTTIPGAPQPGVSYPRRFPMESPVWSSLFRVNENGGWMRIGLVHPL